MVSVTFTVDPEVLEAAQIAAIRRQTSLDQVVADSLATFAHSDASADEIDPPSHEEKRRKLLDLMYSGPLGEIDRPLTREEIYAERTWPHS